MSPARNWTIIAVLGLGQMVAFASSFYLLGVLADPIAKSFGIRASLLFAALSLAFLVSAVTSPAVGRWVDRRGGRGVLMASNLVFASGLGLIAVAQHELVACAGILILGLGMSGGLYGTAFAILVAIHRDNARRSITAVSLLGALGGGLGWPISLVLLEAVGWRGACLAWAAAHLALCLPATALLIPPAQGMAHAPIQSAKGPRWDRRMVQVAILFAGSWTISTATSAHLPRLLRELGLSASQAVVIAGLTAAAAIAVRLLDLTVLGRTSPVVLSRVAATLHPLGAVAAGLGRAQFAAALTVLQGAGNGLLSVASGTLPLHLFGAQNYAARHALLLTPARFMQAAGPLLYGMALDRSVEAALACSSIVCIVMFVCTFRLERRAARSA